MWETMKRFIMQAFGYQTDALAETRTERFRKLVPPKERNLKVQGFLDVTEYNARTVQHGRR
jgi:hypothetical protein